MEEECQSWEDRCNRYFSSLSDTEKDHGQEKHAAEDHRNIPNSELDRHGNVDEITKSERDDDGNKRTIPWKSLSEMRKLYSEHWVLRHSRKVLAGLDIHGSRISYRAKTRTEMLAWLLISLAGIAVTVYLVYALIDDYSYNRTYYVSKHGNGKLNNKSRLSVTICNMNVLKSSLVDGNSRLSMLKNYTDGTSTNQYFTTPVNIQNIISANVQLSMLLREKLSDDMDTFVDNLKDNVIIQEMLTSSSKSLIQRLQKYGRPDLLVEILGLTRSEVESMGYTDKDLIQDCWIDEHRCRTNDYAPHIDPRLGQCLTFSPPKGSRSLQLVLDAKSEEYISLLSPTIGFVALLHHPGEDPASGKNLHVAAGQHTFIEIGQIQISDNIPDSCGTIQNNFKRCLSQQVEELCDCTLYDGSTRCDMSTTATYLCYKAVEQLLHLIPEMCECLDTQVEVISTSVSQVQWPSAQYLTEQSEYWQNKIDRNISFVRENFAKLTVNLKPRIVTSVTERQELSLLYLLSSLGGISAFICGLSVVSLLELFYLAVKSVVMAVKYCNNRSPRMPGVQKLTDSEITSITWAMYRQRRQHEEKDRSTNMEAADTQHNTKHALTGNAHNILKRYSVHSDGDLANKGETIPTHPLSNHYSTPDKQCFHRRYDSRQDWNQSRYRNRVYSGPYFIRTQEDAVPGSDTSHYGDSLTYKYSGAFQTALSKSEGTYNRHTYHVRNNRMKSVPEHVESEVQLQRQPNEDNSVQFYNGTSAYYSQNNISEPVYL